jgi:hypothetical protein
VGVAPTVEGYHLLGNLAERLEDGALATDCYRKGMTLATGASAQLPAPVSGADGAEAGDDDGRLPAKAELPASG